MQPRKICIGGASSLVSLTAILASLASTSRAETLADAIALAYQSNPTLQQARAQLRALDETEVQAKAGWRPTLGVSASDDYENVLQKPSYSTNSGGLTLGLSQNIYTSGKTAATVRSADAGIRSGRETLRATEASVLYSVVQAYEDVLRDQTTLQIRQDDVAALSRVLDEVSAKRQVGQITRTDVLQIQSQQATAQANLAAAQAQLQNSRAEYVAAVGQNPGTLEPPPTLPELPKDVDAAFNAAESDNPNLRASKYTEESDREKIAEAKAAFGPTVAVGAQVGYSGSTTPAQTVDYSRAVTAQVVVSQPLFAGGANASLTRQAIQQDEADRIGVEKTRRQVVQSVAQAWNDLISVERMRASEQSAYDSAKLELEGMQAEYKVALRSTLEVLSADEALRAAELGLATADHDGYLAQAALLNAMGRLEAGKILTGASLYDPKHYFKEVRNKGATPYEGIIAGLDSISIGHVVALPPVEVPKTSPGPPVLQSGDAPSPDAPLATASPAGAVAEAPPTPGPALAAAGPKPKSKLKRASAKAAAPSPPALANAASGSTQTAPPAPPTAPSEVITTSQLAPPEAETVAASPPAAAAPAPAPAEAPPASDTASVLTTAPGSSPAMSGPGIAAQASPAPAPLAATPVNDSALAYSRAYKPDASASAAGLRGAESAGERTASNEGATARPAPRLAGASTAAVQIGAFATVALAEECWSDVKSLIPAQVQGKSRMIQPVSANGATLYRAMVVGFESYANAGRFCESLKAKGVDCFVKSDQPLKTG